MKKILMKLLVVLCAFLLVFAIVFTAGCSNDKESKRKDKDVSISEDEEDKITLDKETDKAEDKEENKQPSDKDSDEDKENTGDEVHVHNHGDWIIDKEATKTEDGARHRECTVCGAVESEIIYAIGSQGLSYYTNYDETECKITGMGTCTDTELYIPAYIDGHKVTAVDYGFSRNESITKVTIANGIESISDLAFSRCTALKAVVIPESVTVIGEQAFFSCDNLKNIWIPKSVTSIGYAAFAGCPLKAIDVDPENTVYKDIEGSLYTKDGETLIQYAILRNDQSFVIPNSVKTIGGLAFYDADKLRSVVIPDGVTEIKDYSFAYCSQITQIDIPEGVETIGKYAFYECKKLKDVSLPLTLSSIGESAFAYCETLLSVVIPSNVTSIDNSAFGSCSKLKNITINEGVTYIGESAFAGCPISVLEIPSTISKIDATAFQHCNLMDIRVSESNNSYKVIDGNLYSKDGTLLVIAKKASEIDICNGTTVIGESVFAYKDKITVRIPASVTMIERKAFYYLYNAEKIVYSGTKAQWEEILKAEDSFQGTTIRVNCTDGYIDITAE